MYIEKDFVRIAKRENNTKRLFLIVDPLQGKHIPVSPSKAICVFSDIAKLIEKEYKAEKILIVGFAETATAISSQIAIDLKCDYIQTTREIVESSQYLFFSEEHSHSTEQKLVRNGLDEKINGYDRIIFVDDEISTGKTILNVISSIEKAYNKKFSYSVASILNGMNQDNLDLFKSRNINLHYLVRTNPDEYTAIANEIDVKNEFDSYVKPDLSSKTTIKSYIFNGLINPRKIVDSCEYNKSCKEFWNQLSKLNLVEADSNILVIGTEEFMYPAMFIGKQLEEKGFKVKFHATTRSPIVVSNERTYPLHKRYELRSMYDSDRITYIYDINSYDQVIIVTDANPISNIGLNSVVNALSNSCKKISLIRWSE